VTISLLCLLVLQSAAAPAPSADVLLASVPEGFAIAREYRALTNRGRVSARSSLVWSADGPQVAYVGIRDAEYRPIVGAQMGEAFDFVSTPQLARGRAFFHVVRGLTANTEHHWVLADGKLIGPEDWMSDFAVSPSGERIAYWAQPGALVGNTPTTVRRKYYLTVGSRTESKKWALARGEDWMEIGTGAPVFTSNGESLFSCAVERKGWVLLSRGKREVALCEPVPMIDSFAISVDGSVQAWLRTLPRGAEAPPDPTERDETQLFYRKSRHAKEIPTLARPVLDAGGSHIAFVVIRPGAEFVAIDRQKELSGPYDHVFEMCFDPKGRRLAFVANIGGTPSEEEPGLIEGGESFVVVRDLAQAGESIAHARHAQALDLTWDAKGERLAYRVEDGDGWRVVCGDAVSAAHEEVGAPQFVGDQLRFGTRDKRELWWRELALR
jgi:hypothetical protein